VVLLAFVVDVAVLIGVVTQTMEMRK